MDINEVIINCINVTSLTRQMESINRLGGHVVMIQEHAAGKAIAGEWKKNMAERGWRSHLSPMGTKQKGAGVGCALAKPLNAVPITGSTKRYRQLYEQGR